MSRSRSKLVTDPGKESTLLDPPPKHPVLPTEYHPLSTHGQGNPTKIGTTNLDVALLGFINFHLLLDYYYVHWIKVLKFNHFMDTSKNSLKANLSKIMSWRIRRLLTISVNYGQWAEALNCHQFSSYNSGQT